MSTVRNEDLLALQSYVTAKDHDQYDHLHERTVLLDLTHSNLRQRHVEIRFDRHDTIEKVRRVIHQKTGTPPCFQRLRLTAPCGRRALAEIPSPEEHHDPALEHRPLGYFGVESGSTVHCVDVDPHSGSRGGRYEDVSLVPKYVMSDEDYDRRTGTLRDWERRRKEEDATFSLAKHAREHRERMEALRRRKLGLPLPDGWEYDARGDTVVRAETGDAPPEQADAATEFDAASVAGTRPGARCRVAPGGRRGEVRYVGEVPELGNNGSGAGGGYWVGVAFDEPVGRGDGSVPGGKRYFSANPGYGGFCRGKNVEVGDFPELDLLEDDDDDEL